MDTMASAVSGVNVSAQALAYSANNVANVNTDGYRAKALQRQEQQGGGVRASGVETSQAAASPGGSNVDLATEAVNLLTQGAGYQANLKVVESQQKVLGSTLDIKA